ncbi:hypothetical protein [Streptomyces sp. NPDC051561]|uniref:hypothetical protein n=1 Tax=Streptomyces sp. NPDC051561 TaxID=3365658 RepID=UPI00379FACC5
MGKTEGECGGGGEGRLRAELRGAAASHRPDRARILGRVERGMAQGTGPDTGVRGSVPGGAGASAVGGSRGRRASWPRIAVVTAAVTGVLVAGGYGVSGLLHDDSRVHTATTPPPATSTTDAASPTAPLPAAPPPTASPPSVPPPGGTRTRDGRLWSDGSVDPHSNDVWAQSNVTFKTGTPLTALTVELRIARTPGLAEPAGWTTLPKEDVTFSVREERGEFVYRWTLRPGRTVPVGEHRTAGQYVHAKGGRDAGGDRYSVTTTAVGGQEAEVRGDFYPAR